jgi:hypothetical protein
MRIRFEFSLSEPIRLKDRWPIKVDNIIYGFVGKLDKIDRISVNLVRQPISLAPKFENAGQIHKLELAYEALLPPILAKLDQVQCTIGILIPIEIDTFHYRAYFEAENAEEEALITIKNWGPQRSSRSNRVPFDIAAKGLLADQWPENERKAAQFYRRGRAAINERFFVDAFVNYYFFLERLYAGGKFKSAQVLQRFSEQDVLRKIYAGLDSNSHDKAVQRGAPLDGNFEAFCDWIIGRRGFFQHQSETDPDRWLHSNQEEYSPEAFLIADFAMAVYNARNAHRIFDAEIDQKWVAAAEEVRATMEIIVDIIGDDHAGRPARRRVGINGPGTKVTREMAAEIMMKSMHLAEEYLISIRQITATVKGTNELVFAYTGPVESRSDTGD